MASSGSVVVYTRSGSNWTQQELVANDHTKALGTQCRYRRRDPIAGAKS